jgi:uncharacterized protein
MTKTQVRATSAARNRGGRDGAAARKLERLRGIIARCERVLVAYSGGVDSTFLLAVAREVLEDRVLAATVSFPVVPAAEVKAAKAMARKLGARHVVVPAGEIMRLEAFRTNPPDRCYHCKMKVLGKLVRVARARGIRCVLEASNVDDTKDYRPGHRAVKELRVRSPLIEAGLTKAEIRKLSRDTDLPTWNKPAFACLATRIQHGEPITRGKLERVRSGEEFILSLGFTSCRVRLHGNLARIEVPKGEVGRLLDEKLRRRIVRKMRALGFRYVTIDLEGYRSGSMNAAPRRGRRRTKP